MYLVMGVGSSTICGHLTTIPHLILTINSGLFPDGQFQLLDGDRIAALASLFISEQIRSLPFSLSLGQHMTSCMCVCVMCVCVYVVWKV